MYFLGAEPRRRRGTDYDANPSSFDELDDSEPESEDDKDEAYNSCDDSPDDDDEESDFVPSPVKVSRKAKQTSHKHVPTPPVKKPIPARILKSTRTANKSEVAVGSKASLEDTIAGTNTPKKTLGARIRTGLSSISRTAAESVQQQPKSLGSGRPHTVYRAGLSRNATIPRLHSYLK